MSCTEDELPGLEARCRSKAEAARRVAGRLYQIREGGPFDAVDAPEDPEIAAWGDRLADGFFWSSAREASQSADLSILDAVGGCFEAVAEAIALLRENGSGHQGRLEQALPLLTEAQSALRAALDRAGAPDDADQLEVFEWLKATAARRRVYLKRFMRVDDPADPAGWPALLDRIEDCHLRSQQARRRVATRKPPAGPALTHEATAVVKEARRLLGGRGAVLIGGTCRREAQEALKTALELKQLTWIETKEHQSIAAFEPAIGRPDVALVMLAIRWSSHAFGEVKQFCDRYHKPLVRLPGGYSPNQVATQVVVQCSAQLGG